MVTENASVPSSIDFPVFYVSHALLALFEHIVRMSSGNEQCFSRLNLKVIIG